jgi:hypothetical protein
MWFGQQACFRAEGAAMDYRQLVFSVKQNEE